jgi:dTDP-4-dehydrorhamnose 3,5-epimerase
MSSKVSTSPAAPSQSVSSKWTILPTPLAGLILLEPRIHSDPRGSFFESYHQQDFAQLGITCAFVQDNHSVSQRGTLRGLHYQVNRPQDKLCRVVVGEVLDVAVDLRAGSPTFGRWASFVLSAENHRQLFIPGGFAHGFLALSEGAEFLYKCSDFYSQPDERGIVWNDPTLAIDWQIKEPLLSARDAALPRLASVAKADLPV